MPPWTMETGQGPVPAPNPAPCPFPGTAPPEAPKGARLIRLKDAARPGACAPGLAPKSRDPFCFALSGPGAQVLGLRDGGPAPRATNARWRPTAGPALLPGGSGGPGAPRSAAGQQSLAARVALFPLLFRKTVGRITCNNLSRPSPCLAPGEDVVPLPSLCAISHYRWAWVRR